VALWASDLFLVGAGGLLDSTTIGAVLACVAGLIGSVVVYVGKRGENSTSRFNSVTDQVQEEVIRKTAELSARRPRSAS